MSVNHFRLFLWPTKGRNFDGVIDMLSTSGKKSDWHTH